MHEQLSAMLRYIRGLGAGRVLAGVLITMLLGGPALGLVAAANPGGVRTAVADAIGAKNSDDDEDAGLLTPQPGAGSGTDSPDTSLSPASAETPSVTATQTATPSPTATVTATPSGTMQATVTAQPTLTPTLTLTLTPTLAVCPTSPSSSNSVSAASACSPDSQQSPSSPI